ncbi:hypothetical protein B0H12DRAFT_1146371 [Mycena haematopus]|nr:hypothetical protein B0H12DRAFT_1146371 [Mycena haematopus]
MPQLPRARGPTHLCLSATLTLCALRAYARVPILPPPQLRRAATPPFGAVPPPNPTRHSCPALPCCCRQADRHDPSPPLAPLPRNSSSYARTAHESSPLLVRRRRLTSRPTPSYSMPTSPCPSHRPRPSSLAFACVRTTLASSPSAFSPRAVHLAHLHSPPPCCNRVPAPHSPESAQSSARSTASHSPTPTVAAPTARASTAVALGVSYLLSPPELTIDK